MAVEPAITRSFGNLLVVKDDDRSHKKTINLVELIELEEGDDDDDDIRVISIVKREGTSGSGGSSSSHSRVMTSRGLEEKDAISVEQYCEERNLNFESPRLQSPKQKAEFCEIVQCVDDYEDTDEIRILSVEPSSLFRSKKPKPFSSHSVTEIGESSSRSGPNDDQEQKQKKMFDCEICCDTKPHTESFSIKGCIHAYCADCMRNYVASKLEEGASQINCPAPNCQGVLEPEYCRDIIPHEVFNRWGNVLCESVILASEKFYCPFKDCSALLIDDGVDMVTSSECPNCWRLFCAKCKVPWHNGIGCDEFQKLGKDERGREDIMFKSLAKNKNWQRCPKCKVYVERTEGCLYMKCRCGTAFCYRCGNITKDHQYHSCSYCQKIWG